MTRSLQSRLMLGTGVSMAAVLLVAGILLYLVVRGSLLAEFDSDLEKTCRSLAGMVETDGQRVESEMADRALPRSAGSDRPDWYQILGASGRIIESSPGLVEQRLAICAGQGPLSVGFAELPDGRPGRSVALRFVPRFEPPHETDLPDHESIGAVPAAAVETGTANPGGTGDAAHGSSVTLVVARDTTEMNRTLHRIRWLIGVVTGCAILAGVLLSSLVARWGLSSLRTTAAQIAAIDGGNLNQILETAAAPREVQPMVQALNQMLHRLRMAFDRERQFSANVAHELRTPLAGLTSTIEVATTRRRDLEEYQTVLQKCLSICNQTEAIVDNLFMLARVDAGQCTAHRELIDMAHLIRQVWQPFEPLAQQRNLMLDWNLDESLQVSTDNVKLALVLRNLFDNSVSYAESGTAIEVHCAAGPSDGMARIRISNSVSDFSPSDMEQLFERFWRADHSRSQTGQHSGLGLPLCRSLIQLLGGSIHARLIRGHRLDMMIELPCPAG